MSYYDSEYEYYRAKIDDRIDDEMKRYKAEALRKLHLIAPPYYFDEFVEFFVLAIQEKHKSVKKILKNFDLGKEHVAALLDDRDEMERLFLDEQGWAQADHLEVAHA